MADFESLNELTARFAQGGPDSRWQEAAPSAEARIISGERHGSWFVELRWAEDEIDRVAALAVTAADVRGQRVYLNARAGATTDARYVVESIEQLSRVVSRVKGDDLDDLLAVAVERAQSYTASALVDAYETPASTTPEA